MEDLFDKKLKQNLSSRAPLADRMRPRDFDGFFGQDDLIGKNSPLREAIRADNLNSIIFWGPPGSGKTTLAKIIANKTESHFVKFSAVEQGVKDLRQAIKKSKDRLKFKNQSTIVFIDEIHRFNKAQQDALLPHTEQGTIILIGATTENPSFEVISPLLSRSSVYVLKPLSEQHIKKIIIRALRDKERGLGEFDLKITDKALKKLAVFADGDARSALNTLEFTANYLKSKNKKRIDQKTLSKILKKHALRYDKKGEEHYNLISAFIKSMRDSDPDGALYWLARMVESGEDPKFIARRMVIFASEDIGNADPNALGVATSIARAVEYVGMPEAQINLAQGVTYLSKAPKSRASYKALFLAKKDAKKGSFGVPLHLRNAVTSLMKKLGYGRRIPQGGVPNKKLPRTHFPDQIGDRQYYKEEK